jgi:hypothetical protein
MRAHFLFVSAFDRTSKRDSASARDKLLKIYQLYEVAAPSDIVDLDINLLYSVVCLRLDIYQDSIDAMKTALLQIKKSTRLNFDEKLYLNVYAAGILDSVQKRSKQDFGFDPVTGVNYDCFSMDKVRFTIRLCFRM